MLARATSLASAGVLVVVALFLAACGQRDERCDVHPERVDLCAVSVSGPAYYWPPADQCVLRRCGCPPAAPCNAPFDSTPKCEEACLEALWWKRALRGAGVPFLDEVP